MSVARILDLGSSVATSRGTLIHAWFEQLEWLDDGPPDPALLRRVAKTLDRAELNVERQLDAFQRMLEMPAIAAALSRASYQPPYESGVRETLPAALADVPLRAEVHNERRFAVFDDGRLLSGIIDRLVLLYDGDQLVAADIIDYKTDALGEGDPRAAPRLVEHYRPQLDAYRRAVARMFRLPADHICARLLLVSTGLMRVV